MSTLDPDTMTVTVPVRLAIESAGKKRERTIDLDVTPGETRLSQMKAQLRGTLDEMVDDLAYDSIKDKL
jgi:hypothetical protein